MCFSKTLHLKCLQGFLLHLCFCWISEQNYTAWKVSAFRVFLGRIFPHLDWIRRDTLYLSAFSPNAGQCRSELFVSASCSGWITHDLKLMILCFNAFPIFCRSYKNQSVNFDFKLFYWFLYGLQKTGKQWNNREPESLIRVGLTEIVHTNILHSPFSIEIIVGNIWCTKLPWVCGLMYT